MKFRSTCASSASRSPHQCSPEYSLVWLRRCTSRVPTLRKRSEKLAEGQQEVAVRVAFARRSSLLRWRCRLCCSPAQDCFSEASCGCNQLTQDSSRNTF